MNHQQQKDNSDANESITTQEAIDLLFGEGWLEEAVCIEDEANCTIGAGLDWGNALAPLMLNLPLFGRLSTLRVSLNREVRLIIETWDLGIGTSSAIETARARIKERLLCPTPELIPQLEATLLQDDLYDEVFINVSKRKPNSDISCILKPGLAVPNFITQESVVVYKYAREFSAEEISSFQLN